MPFKWRYLDGPMPDLDEGELFGFRTHTRIGLFGSQATDPDRPDVRGLLADQINKASHEGFNYYDGRAYEPAVGLIVETVEQTMDLARSMLDSLGYAPLRVDATVRVCRAGWAACNGLNMMADELHPATFAVLNWPERIVRLRHPAGSRSADF